MVIAHRCESLSHNMHQYMVWVPVMHVRPGEWCVSLQLPGGTP